MNISSEGRNFLVGCLAVGSFLLFKALEYQHETKLLSSANKKKHFYQEKRVLLPNDQKAIEDLSTRELKVILQERGILENAGVERKDLEKALIKHLAQPASGRVLFVDDICLEIFSYLDDIHDLLQCSVVCSAWCRISSGDILWKEWFHNRMTEHVRNNRKQVRYQPYWRFSRRHAMAVQKESNQAFWNTKQKFWNLMRKALSNAKTSSRTHFPADRLRTKYVSTPMEPHPTHLQSLHVPHGQLSWKQLIAGTQRGLHKDRNVTSSQIITRTMIGGHNLVNLLHQLAIEFESIEASFSILLQFLEFYGSIGSGKIEECQGVVFKLPPPHRGSVSCSHKKFVKISATVGLTPNSLEELFGPHVNRQYGSHLVVLPSSEQLGAG